MRSQRGFTLLEALITLGVISIICTLGIPGLSGLLKDNQRAALVNEFVSALYFARSESVVRQSDVVVCNSADGRTCANSDATWDRGWIVFANTDNDSPIVVDPGEPVLAVHAAVTATAHIKANQSHFSFHPLPKRSINGTVTFCDDRGAAKAIAVIINVLGRPRLSNVAADGSPLVCP